MKFETHKLSFGLAAAALLLLTGCDLKLAGQKGVIDFHPDNCGAYALGCNFEKPIVVGGTIDVRLDGEFGSSKLSLRPEDTSLLSVTPSESGNPTRFSVQALGAGTTLLMAMDESGEVVDQIVVETMEVDTLRVRPFINVPDEPETDIEGAQTFRVPQDKTIAFWVGPDVGDDWQGMGNLTYELIDASPELEAAMEVDESMDMELGFVSFRMPEGSHQLVVGTADGNHVLSLIFIAE